MLIVLGTGWLLRGTAVRAVKSSSTIMKLPELEQAPGTPA
jgi:hypothetical protein